MKVEVSRLLWEDVVCCSKCVYTERFPRTYLPSVECMVKLVIQLNDSGLQMLYSRLIVKISTVQDQQRLSFIV